MRKKIIIAGTISVILTATIALFHPAPVTIERKIAYYWNSGIYSSSGYWFFGEYVDYSFYSRKFCMYDISDLNLTVNDLNAGVKLLLRFPNAMVGCSGNGSESNNCLILAEGQYGTWEPDPYISSTPPSYWNPTSTMVELTELAPPPNLQPNEEYEFGEVFIDLERLGRSWLEGILDNQLLSLAFKSKIEDTDSYGNIWWFSDHPGDNPQLGIRPPPATLTNPINNQIVNPEVTFTWSSSPKAQSYDFQVSKSPDFNQLIENRNTTQLSLNLTIPGDGIFYWRVRARADFASSWTTETFRLLFIPTLSLPENNSVVFENDSITFTWGSTLSQNYRFQISDNPSFQTLIKDIVTSQTSINLEEYKQPKTYYWRVRSESGTNYSNWSETRVYSVSSISMPENLSPRGQSINWTDTMRLEWANVYGATKYQIQISDNSNFANILRTLETTDNYYLLTPSAIGLSGSKEGKTYYWRVRAVREA